MNWTLGVVVVPVADVDPADVQVLEGGGPRPARQDDEPDCAGFVLFEDPDGNAWAVQQMPGCE